MSSISTLTGVPTGGTLEPAGEPEQVASTPQLPTVVTAEIVQNEIIVTPEESKVTLPSDSPNHTSEKPPVDPSVSVVTDKIDDTNEVTPKPEAEIVQSNPEPEIIQPSLDVNPKNVLNDIIEDIEQVASDNLQTTSPNKEATKEIPETISEENEAESGKIDIKELTSQILNIISDDDNQETVVPPPQQLLKKNVELQEFILKLVQVLREKTELCEKLERQNAALIGQAQSLREVISITKDLLSIRNMEVEHLHQDMNNMEERIKDERVRHNTAVNRLNEAMKLNDQLKNEYLIQMDLFQRLRDKYNEKIVLLTNENKRLLEIIKSNGLENLLVQVESVDEAESAEEKLAPSTAVTAAGEEQNNASSVVDNGLSPVEEVVDK